MTTMRAVAMTEIGGPEVLQSIDAPMPVRANAEVLVKVLAAGVNPIDAKTRSGRGVSGAIRAYPAILGYDLCGEIVESPYQAHPLQPGRRVYGMTMVPRLDGTYAEYAVVPEAFLTPAPTTLSPVEAAAVPLAALTAWGMVVDVARAHDGQRMLIHAGAGGVGHFAVQLAAYFGARVTATASQRNVGWLHELGASRVIDYSAERFDEAVDEVDVVIDLIGNVHDNTGSRSLSVLRPGGLLVNAPTGSWPTMDEEAAAAGVRATGYRVAPSGSTLAVIARLIDSGDLRVHVDRTFPLAEAAEAHRLLEGGHVRGKLVLTVAE
ncbi:NADP-dependent oxidoreductase [Microcella sp.]|uniref:NADP-dependent oxidoreductase n=1 Tax=Microcella sp. TaxID=1913979 RepID=UPI00391CF42F